MKLVAIAVFTFAMLLPFAASAQTMDVYPNGAGSYTIYQRPPLVPTTTIQPLSPPHGLAGLPAVKSVPGPSERSFVPPGEAYQRQQQERLQNQFFNSRSSSYNSNLEIFTKLNGC